jgi:exodeoxyribonuclease VIII
MNNEEYHAAPALGSSGIKLLLRSPAHFWSAWIDPARVRKTPTAAMQFGTAVHAAILEPETLHDAVVRVPDDAPDKRSKAGKEWWVEFSAAHAKKVLLSHEDWCRMLDVRDAVLAHPTAPGLLHDIQVEHSIFYVDREYGYRCKIRPDALKVDRSLIIDVKTCEDASPRGFQQAMQRYGYPIQAAWYVDGITIAEDRHRQPGFMWLAVETEPPFGIGLYLCDNPTLLWGRAQVDRARAIYAKCLHSNEWPCYSPRVQTINLPKWALRTDAVPDAF